MKPPLQPAAPDSSPSQDPANQIAVALFGTLAMVAFVAIFVGLPFWVNKLPTTTMFVILTAAALWARKRSFEGAHVQAMHVFAILTALMAIPLMALSTHLTAPTLMLVTVLPAYAAVCGRHFALGLGLSYLLAAVAVLLAPMADIAIPKLFPTPPAAEVVAAAIAMAGVLGPLAVVFARLRDSIRAMQTENQQRIVAERALA